MSVKFPFEKWPSVIFGSIHRPVAVAYFWSIKALNWKPISLVIDTGADYTILPRYEATNLGVDLKKDCTKYLTAGVGGTEEVFLLKSWKVRLGEIELSAPIGFLNKNNIPPLLGRENFLEKLDVRLVKHVSYFS